MWSDLDTKRVFYIFYGSKRETHSTNMNDWEWFGLIRLTAKRNISALKAIAKLLWKSPRLLWFQKWKLWPLEKNCSGFVWLHRGKLLTWMWMLKNGFASKWLIWGKWPKILLLRRDLDIKGLLWCGMASREKAITLNSTADLYPEELLWIGLAQGKLWSKV